MATLMSLSPSYGRRSKGRASREGDDTEREAWDRSCPMNARSPTALAMLLALGCSASRPAPAPAPSPVAAIAPPSPVAVAPTPEAPAPSPVAELAAGEAQAVLDAWLRAQNTNDLAGYERLYAPRFTGVRRSGPRVRRFDRAGWMTDRRAMFQAAMQVSARDVAIVTGPEVATVRFTQDFTQGRFHDTGPKELVLVRAGGALSIVREEMLESRLGGGAQAPAEPPTGALMHVLSPGHERWIVLARASDDGSWSRGEPVLVDRDAQQVATRRDIDPGAVPQSLRELRGQAVRVFSGDGSACDARLGELAVLGRIDVHFGTEQRWSGEAPDGTRGPRMSDREVAREAWHESDGGMLLVARLDDASGCSATPLYGRLASLPPATVFAPSTADPALGQRALSRFRALPSWRRLQSEYRESGATGPNWDSHERTSAPVVKVWQAPGSARRFVTVSASTTVGGCAEFSARLTAVFEVGGPQGLILHSDPAEPGAFEAQAAVDIDGDGVPEFVTADGYVRRAGTVLRSVSPLAVPSHDCPC